MGRHGGNQGGRPKGSKDPHTIERQRTEAAIRERVHAEIGPMTDAQIAAAKGIKYLVGRAKQGGKFKHLTAEQVQACLEGKDSEYEVLELWEKIPSTQAFEELMDRTLGKAPQPVEAEVSGEIAIRWQGE